MKANTRMTIFCPIILVSVTLLAASCSKDAPSEAKRSIPAIFYEVIDQLDKARASTQAGILADMGLGDLVKEFEAQLKKDPNNIWLRLNLAYSYQTQRDYRRALDHYFIANAQQPDIADPLIGLGRICYDLALVDMMQRKIVKTHQSGLPQFVPDERSRLMLEEARTFLLEAKTKKQLSKRQGNSIITISPPGTADQFLEMIEAKIGTKGSR